MINGSCFTYHVRVKEQFTDFKAFLLAGSAVITFSHFVYNLFGYTIPQVVTEFFKEFGAAVVMMSIFIFAMAWLINAKPHQRPKEYSVVCYDVFGNESEIDGLRTEFKTHDVAWSFMKNYKKSYPLYNFALVSDLPDSEKKTIFKYL